jgi:UDPglucose 6-dehydrogenase
VEEAASAADACVGADAVVAATEWPEFRGLDWATIATTMPGRIIADGRHVIDAQAARAAGYDLVVLGVATQARDVAATSA